MQRDKGLAPSNENNAKLEETDKNAIDVAFLD